ncbi:hypothetical protein ACHHYP_01982 [Achlya hypogyna]|uniref:HECT domain-containing protein n=1 Tax=Achlya hypogyna TaxID=1202772 RepID=A0A1V9Z7U4_ACHHY|nr:hypothetical protein ACHHYP_01982 [Achlya hypogyna]
MHVVRLIVALWAAVVAAALDKAQRVPVTVIFRAYCPACQWYIGDPLLKLVNDPEFRAITDLSLNPAAGMVESDGAFACSGGPSECEGHRWFACILEKDKDSVETYMKHMACMEGREGSDTWQSRLEFCYPDPADISELRKCKAEASTELLRSLIVQAQAHDAGWMPYTIVNGIVLGDATKGVMLKELKTDICKKYTGPAEYLPKECYGIPGVATPIVLPTDAAKAVPAAVEAATASPLTTPPPAMTSSKVSLQVVWRAFCPGCKWYITDPLAKVLEDPEFADIVSFEPYPSGSTEGVAGAFTCAGGASECIGHRYMSCVIHLHPKVSEQAKHLACIEGSNKPRGAWNKIIATCFQGAALARMKTCFEADSERLLEKSVAYTNTVESNWLPHTTVAGQVIGTATEGVGYEQLSLSICNAYKGPATKRPRACPVPPGEEIPTAAVHEMTTAAPVATADDDDGQPVRPCKQREKGFVYEDAPDIGQRGLRQNEAKPVKLQAKIAAPSSGMSPLLVPALIVGTIVFVVFKFSKTSEKKDIGGEQSPAAAPMAINRAHLDGDPQRDFDELIGAGGDPETRLLFLYELIEALHLHQEEDDGEDGGEDGDAREDEDEDECQDEDRAPTSPLVELATLTGVLVNAYYCPTTMLLVLRAMNALFDTDPAFAMDGSLNEHVVQTVIYAAMSLHDLDTIEQALRWSRAVARDRPTWFLASGSAYHFLTTITTASHLSTKKRALELALRAANVPSSQEHAVALLAMADLVVPFLDDPEPAISDLAFQWTTDALMLVLVHDLSYVAAYAHDTSVLSAWAAHFPQWPRARQRALLGFLAYVAGAFSHSMLLTWSTLLSTHCLMTTSTPAETDMEYYDLKAAAVALLSKVAALHDSELVSRPPYTPEWSCGECTMLQPMDHVFCGVCGAPRIASHFEQQQQGWLVRKLRYELVVSAEAAPTATADGPPLAAELAPVFAAPIAHFLEVEAQELALVDGIPLYAQLLLPDDRDGWARVASLLALVQATGRHDDWVRDQIDGLAARCGLGAADGAALLRRHGLHQGNPSHALVSLVKQLRAENDTHRHKMLYDAIAAACASEPPTLFECSASGWLDWVATMPAAAFASILPSVRATIDARHFAAEFTSAPLGGQWERTPLPLRVWRPDGASVDVLAHPLLPLHHVARAALSHAGAAAKTTAFACDATLDVLDVPDVATDDVWVLAWGQAFTGADLVLAAALATTTNPVALYELHIEPAPRPPSQWACFASGTGKPMPRLTQAFGAMAREEWRLMCRAVPATMAALVQAQPESVPLSMRSDFFLGSKAVRHTREALGGRTTVILARDALLAETSWKTVPPTTVLYVAYEGEAGHGVGPTTEFYTLLSRAIAAPGLGLWRDVDAPLFPAPLLATDTAKMALLATLGHALGRAFLDGYNMSVRLAPALIKLLQGRALEWDDMRAVDASLHRSLALVAQAEDVEALGLYFNLPGNDKYPLCAGGCDRPVTAATRDEYIGLVREHVLQTSIEGSVAALRRGFASCLPVSTWRYFTVDEWQMLLHRDAPWTREDLQSGLFCRSGYTWESLPIQWLVAALVGFSAAERSAFLTFVTGSPCLPLAGWSALALTVVPAAGASDDALPSCNTCQKYLKLPRYSTDMVLAAKLRVAITDGQGHFALD